MQGISLQESYVQKRGLQEDRRFMVVDEDGQFLTQRTAPKLAQFQTALQYNSLLIKKEASQIQINPFDFFDNERKMVSVWNSTVESICVGKEIDDWLSFYLERKVHLVYQPETTKRRLNPAFSSPLDEVSFADGYPILACTDASLKDLNQRLTKPIGMERFRPNLVFSDVQVPFEEDNWQNIWVGTVEMRSIKPCIRCVMTTLNQETGHSEGKEPLKTLATFRIKAPYTAPLFGQNLIPNQEGIIKVGDILNVLK